MWLEKQQMAAWPRRNFCYRPQHTLSIFYFLIGWNILWVHKVHKKFNGPSDAPYTHNLGSVKLKKAQYHRYHTRKTNLSSEPCLSVFWHTTHAQLSKVTSIITSEVKYRCTVSVLICHDVLISAESIPMWINHILCFHFHTFHH